jgi:hypothetical protein
MISMLSNLRVRAFSGLGALCGILALLTSPAFGASCPRLPPANVNSTLYSFEASSWWSGKPQSGSSLPYEFGRSVQNRKSQTLWVDWLGMSLSGYVAGNGIKSSSIPSFSDDCDKAVTDLWYGDKPLLLPRVNAIRTLAEKPRPGLLEVALAFLNKQLKSQGKAFATSSSDLFVPVDPSDKPERFVKFVVRFSSEVSSGDYKLSIWFQPSAESNELLGDYFRSKTVDQILFSTVIYDDFIGGGLGTNRVSYRKADFLSKSSAGVNKAPSLPSLPPQIDSYRVAHLFFQMPTGRMIGMMPVVVIEPNLRKEGS